MNKLTTIHTINHNGLIFIIKGDHKYKYATVSKLRFFIYLGNHGTNITSKRGVKICISELLKTESENKARAEYYKNRNRLTPDQIISHKDFAYARFISSSLGNYYSLYLRDEYSPTGRSLAGSCNESVWEELSVRYNQQNNYLAPGEKY
jgi:hypothetical protein